MAEDLRSTASAARLKRTIVNLEAGNLFLDPACSIDRQRPGVRRRPRSTVTAACLDGSVLALMCFEVMQVTEARGPAAVVRIIDHRRWRRR